MAREVVGPVSAIPPGSQKVISVRGREIAVFNVHGEFFAFLNRCPHQGAKLCAGAVIGLVESSEPGTYRYSRRGEMLRCPWHGWEFDLRTGQSWCTPDKVKVRQYPTAVIKGGPDLVKGPYVAETYDVSIEHDYVVVDI
jgi:3-phenylpropionate/trans-cinnamate dioxygenase ferredoxin subunit